MDRWKDGWMNRWINGRKNELKEEHLAGARSWQLWWATMGALSKQHSPASSLKHH